MFGVDEAGRGPVLGSMFVACVAVESETTLPSGLRDSKRLSKARIATLADALRETAGISISVVEVPTARIDDEDETMTTVTVDAFADAITSASTTSEVGILDACHPDANTFRTLIAEAASRSEETLTAEHGADDEYPIVSAASIIAKDARERHVATLAEEYGDVGSGYPSDPTTKTFLTEYVATNGDLPGCARRSWKTSQNALEEAGQTDLDTF
jgi:ribonuclease HII